MIPHFISRIARNWLIALLCIAGFSTICAEVLVKDFIRDLSQLESGSYDVVLKTAKKIAEGGDKLGYRSTPATRNNDKNTITDHPPMFRFSGYRPPSLPKDQRGKYVYGMAVFSDDGCNVSINGHQIHSAFKIPQTLQNLDQSLHVLPVLLLPDVPVDISVEYSNTIYTATDEKPDIDGCMLFLFRTPFKLRDIKGAGEADDQVIAGMEPVPVQQNGEAADTFRIRQNAYFQQQVPDDCIAFIDPHRGENNSPDMPRLVARIPGWHGIKLKWRLEVEYLRGNGYRNYYVKNFTQPEDKVMIPSGLFDKDKFTTKMDAGKDWQIFADWEKEIKVNGFFGGTAKLFLWPSQQETEPKDPIMTFRIGGKNPEPDKAQNYITDKKNCKEFWYAYAIAKAETTDCVKENDKIRYYNQFFTAYQGGTIGDHGNKSWAAWAKGWPIYCLDRNLINENLVFEREGGG